MTLPGSDELETNTASADATVATAAGSSVNTSAPGVDQRARKWIIAVALALVAFSVVIRLDHLDSKPFWFDEEIVAVLISSTTEPSLWKHGGQAMPASDWRQLESVSATAPLTEVLNNLKVKLPPDQAPLYCLAARMWIQAFGNSVYSIRLLSVIFSFLAFPIIFLLSREMFKSIESAWLSVALLACSPFQLLFAQEARQYTMWACAAAVAWIALARAHKHSSAKQWIAFGIASAISILTHYASFLLVAASGVVSLISNRKSFGGLAIGAISCVLFISPWFIYAGLGGLNSCNEPWMLSHKTPEQYLFECALNGARIFLDFPWPWQWYMRDMVDGIFLLEFIAIALAYKRATREGRLILLSAALYILVIALLDLTSGGGRLLIVRYLTPITVLTQICVASCIFDLLRTRAKLAIILFSVIACAGAVSCLNIVNSPECWNKYPKQDDLSLAAKLNQTENCLFVCRESFDALLMSRLVHANVLIENAAPEKVSIPPSVDNVFLAGDFSMLRSMHRHGGWRRRRVDEHVWQLMRAEPAAVPSQAEADQIERPGLH